MHFPREKLSYGTFPIDESYIGGWLTRTGNLECAVAISPDKTFIVTGARGNDLSFNDGIAAWDLQGQRLPMFRDEKQWVGHLAFSPDGSVLAAADVWWDTYQAKKTLSLWKITAQPEKIHEFNNLGSNKLVFSADGKKIWSADNPMINEIDVDSLRKSKSFSDHVALTQSIASLPSSNGLVSTSSDRSVRIWDANTGLPTVIGGEIGEGRSTAVSPDGRSIVSGDNDGWITLRNLDLPPAVPEIVRSFSANGAANIGSISFSPDGKLLYVGFSPLAIVDAYTLRLKGQVREATSWLYPTTARMLHRLTAKRVCSKSKT